MRKLRTYVHVDGEVYGPGSEVPPSVAERITNPKAWAGDSADAGPVAVVEVQDEEQDEEQAPVVEGDPPRPGKNAKVETWRAYILAVADVTEAGLEGLTRDQLIEMADQLDNEE